MAGAETVEGARAPEAAAPELPEAPSQAELAREVAKGVVEDLVPPATRRILLVVALIVAIGIVAVVLRGCT
jgi:hypothetical protein